MNVLFVGGGRRVELANRFIARGYNIFAYELHKAVPISSVAKVIEGYSWGDKEIYDHIRTSIYKYNIGLVIPLQDEAVRICSQLKYTSTVMLTSDYDVADICFDKFKFEDFMMNHAPKIYPKDTGVYPKIAKPRFGFGSRSLKVFTTPADIVLAEEQIGERLYFDYVIQRKIHGVEYSVDSYSNRAGNCVDSVPRIRVRVGSGEVITSRTIINNSLKRGTIGILNLLGIRGPSNVQWIIDTNGEPWILEVNARFGGGYTLSMEAGLDAISLIERDYFGKKYTYPQKIKSNLLLERSYHDHFFER